MHTTVEIASSEIEFNDEDQLSARILTTHLPAGHHWMMNQIRIISLREVGEDQ